ncbi:hypothetical protein M3221_16470 [Domibacillus indicus]|uniref:hypothetical protein n=1 Tax=Domibacillus indicus TaxID=1437523 RepID=UPI002040B3EA|nr:hypothetical protein [Domibacillus indicus]MCM3789985.1 hypothetical protein [Domibacillus indicus]
MANLYMERLKDRWVIRMKDTRLNGVSVSLSVDIKDWLRKKENRPAKVCRTLRQKY